MRLSSRLSCLAFKAVISCASAATFLGACAENPSRPGAADQRAGEKTADDWRTPGDDWRAPGDGPLSRDRVTPGDLPQKADAGPRTDGPGGCRDPVLWPFTANSIWNTAIGSNALYVPAGIGPSTQMGMTVDEDVIILEPTAPQVQVAYNDAGWDFAKKRCSSIVAGQFLWNGLKIPVPASFTTDPGYLGITPNQSAAILLSDGVTVKQTQPFHVCGPGGTVTSQYPFADVNIRTGTGIAGAHGGSAMSAIGGTVRVGELVTGAVIRHALKVNLNGGKYLYKGSDGTPGFRWPAQRADSCAASCYGGTNSAMEMGVLLALQPGFAISSLRTEPAKILAQALVDYGAYVVDNTGWDVYGLETEWGPKGRVVAEFAAHWGFSLETSNTSTCTNLTDKKCQWAKDMADIFTNLYAVDNNTATSIGGGGTPRRPPPPPLCAP